MKNWIANTKLNTLLDGGSRDLDGEQVRRLLIEYCERYQEIYPFEILEKPLAYLTQHTSSEISYEIAHAELSIAAAEYCFSLNEISEALLELINTRHLTVAQAKKVINHIFEAYSCNESPEEFIEREDAYLCEKLSSITG
ncbi:hypothetical protein [Pseudomonas sp. RL]|uniref:hypothetical protein n=1 Tax=Pseudomonas sp. RL TaxID=1452718 RepID=UPI0012DD4E08|nr:hypothetical protein [Pseudomonas sp. RL]